MGSQVDYILNLPRDGYNNPRGLVDELKEMYTRQLERNMLNIAYGINPVGYQGDAKWRKVEK